MKLLLDTHTFLWWAVGDPSLSATARTVLADRANEIYLSAVSSWEIAIKVSNGALTLAQPVDSFVDSQILQNQFERLEITLEHTYRVALLPFHHKDPFDRLLIAQAQEEGLILLSHDSKFVNYAVLTLW